MMKDVIPKVEVAPEKNLLPTSLERDKYKPTTLFFLSTFQVLWLILQNCDG